MSTSSDSEEFFDAEDGNKHLNKKSSRGNTLTPSKSESDFHSKLKQEEKNDELARQPVKVPSTSAILQSQHDFVAFDKSRTRLRELRQRMQTEDEELFPGYVNIGASGGIATSPSGSQTSSLADDNLSCVFPETSDARSDTRSSHPFRIIEHDTLSMHSLTSVGGRVSRLLNNNISQDQASMPETKESPSDSVTTIHDQVEQQEYTSSSKEPKNNEITQPINLQEPDVIASTKTSATTIVVSASNVTNSIPIAPPRKKRKNRAAIPPSTLPLEKCDIPKLIKSASAEESSYNITCLPRPASTVESLTRELENSLDITSATKGQYVVKPQDNGDVNSRSLRTRDSSSTYPLSNVSSVIGSSTISSAANQKDLDTSNSNNGISSVGSGNSGHKRERRKSAGDEQSLLKQAEKRVNNRNESRPLNNNNNNNNKVRERKSEGLASSIAGLKGIFSKNNESGKPLSDLEILEQVTVLNLDTGERVPLSLAEDTLPQCLNPLSLQIMRLTSEYVSNTSLQKEKESDEESVDSKISSAMTDEGSIDGRGGVRRKTAKIKKFLGSTVRKTMIRAKTIGRAHNKEDGLEVNSGNTETTGNPGEQYVKLKASNSHKGPFEFDCLQHVQDISGEHTGAIWCMKFSMCGRLLATAGQDKVLRIWVVKNAYQYFRDTRAKYDFKKESPTPSQESLVSQTMLSSSCGTADINSNSSDSPTGTLLSDSSMTDKAPFMPQPLCTYSTHTSDLLDISWSKNYFILSSSMDKTVRLWHISRRECLCCFQHINFVTAIVFHPRDDRYFLSGSLDGKLRLWNIPDKKVQVWNEVDGNKMITSANFCQNGKFAVVGTYDGRCIFYKMDQLKYYTQIDLKISRGRKCGRKISGVEPMPGEDKILITSNDSRIRLYELSGLTLSCKYKGYVNFSSQIKASFSHDGKYIISGSENQCIYIWKSYHDYKNFSSVRKDRNDYWEGIKVHNAVVTCAIFSPSPDIIMKQIDELEFNNGNNTNNKENSNNINNNNNSQGYVIVSADYNGNIKVFINKTKPKHSSLPVSALH